MIEIRTSKVELTEDQRNYLDEIIPDIKKNSINLTLKNIIAENTCVIRPGEKEDVEMMSDDERNKS